MTLPIRRVGIVGLGNMGLPMAANLAAAGFDVTGFDTASAAREAWKARGGTPAPDLGSLAQQVDAIVLMLPNSRVVEEVLADGGVRKALRPGLAIVDMGSSDPLATRALAADLARSGVSFVDAPVSGGVRRAESGTLTVMAGGSDEQLERVRAVLEPLGRVIHVGPVGSGHAIKALNNLLSATHLWVTSEAMVVGERFGLDPRTMLEVFNGSSGRSGSTEQKWPDFVLPGTYDSGFALRLMLKDMRIATALAEQLGVPSVLGEQAVHHWAEAAGQLSVDADHTEVARWLAESASSMEKRP